jgi:hypothetical protein
VKVFGSRTPETCGERFSGNPPSQVAGPSAGSAIARPEVVCGGDGGVIAESEVARLGREPRGVGGLGSAHERERAAEGVDYFLVVAVLALHADCAPRPARRQLPVGDVGRELVRHLMRVGDGGGDMRGVGGAGEVHKRKLVSWEAVANCER